MEPGGQPRSFQLPSAIEDVPGAENWRSMYPYFTRFQPGDDERFWFYNSMHFPEPMPAFDAITAQIPYTPLRARLPPAPAPDSPPPPRAPPPPAGPPGPPRPASSPGS